ncbi:mononuclear molybdenum enzyme YedY [Caldovatus sediminis]|uniref:Protein-methionine-sulfoxide reductase catalytic subunit MsrP n=1 Tax=Caldovatus sediminis TaxID=2041189 RepID=A0A8J2ZF70_9PROT|nr:protein-methionine-sulfoxide reductase catalytic subunit MsrP [Caldovatus sediminis]GGG48623.1 mononuclear molybdenum enzyme YedY [Caldovatus sediminis]
MLIRIRRGWEIPESRVTPEAIATNRRAVLGLAAAGLAAAPPALGQTRDAGAPAEGSPLPPAMRNPRYRVERAITPEHEATTFNNYYEFGSHKSIYRAAQRLPMRPWTVKVEGMVEQPREFGIDDLIAAMPIEERVYRLRCVEAWSMVVPWTGFRLSALLDRVRPLSSARYVRFETAAVPEVMPGLRQSWYPWPYIEGCTIEEAANELAFLVVGAYGRPLPPQNGGPLRVHFPWKYGFKSGKSLVRITLTDRRPKSFWETVQGNEYGFWANVNPEVPHPRWSQATERVLGTGERIPTRIFNGYGEFVAHLYVNLQNERLWA